MLFQTKVMAVLRSCSQFCRIFSLLQVRICPCEPLIPKCGYARGRGGGRRKGQLILPNNLKLSEIPAESQVDDESLFIDPDEGEKSQSFDDFYNTLGDKGPSVADLHEFAKKEREKLKLKILKRKYFKDPQETNLLTWETKEQIRFLHREFPEDWTIEKLAQSFPVSKDGIIKLLKSSYVINTPEKMLQHDLNVKQRWKELEAELSRKGGPINPQYKMLIESGKLELMKNAATLKGAPKKVLHLEDGMKTGAQEVGIFSSIVKDYANNKRQKERMENTKLTQANESELKKLLEAINVQQNNFNHVLGSPSHRTSEEIERSSTHENPATELHKIPRSMRRRLKGEEISIENLSYLETYQMMGTGKVVSSKSDDTNKVVSSKSDDTNKVVSSKSDDTNKVVSSKSDDTNKKASEDVFPEHETKTYFKYSVQQYHSPAQNIQNFNEMRHQSWDPSFQTQIKIPEHMKHKKGVIYKKNDTYYDENGEILYRVPVKE